MTDDPMMAGGVISEHDLGICGYTTQLEEAFKKSCEHNGTTPDNMEYFRSYVWMLMAMMAKRLEQLEERG